MTGLIIFILGWLTGIIMTETGTIIAMAIDEHNEKDNNKD